MKAPLSRAEISAAERSLRSRIAQLTSGERLLVNGAAGAAHLWNRISLITGDTRCREASLRWWEETIELYEKTTPAADAAGVGFLEGPAGLGLALTGALTPVEPAWDGLLCLSSKG